jgi:hypothetical protein
MRASKKTELSRISYVAGQIAGFLAGNIKVFLIGSQLIE